MKSDRSSGAKGLFLAVGLRMSMCDISEIYRVFFSPRATHG